jgi:UDP-3-O-[3-hydroxymyristoyl] glucosamine N-acyltransferase
MSETKVKILGTADVSPSAHLGEGTSVWHLAQIRENAEIGVNCIIGRGAYIGSGVRIGDNCKIQNYALVYEPAILGCGVFIGPAVVLTNDQYPRAINPDMSLKTGSNWDMVGVVIGEGASIGAQSVCVAPIKIGAWALIAAGSVVVNDVPEFALMAGTPAKRIRWVGHAGHPLDDLGDDSFRCPETGRLYKQISPDQLIEMEKN